MQLSVILPCYNVAQYIERAMEGLLNQSYLDYEIIIVDDGSTDNLLEVCRKWEEFENVRIVHIENRGVSEARNQGLRLSKGEFVYFMDPDDWIENDVLGEMMKLFDDGIDAVRGTPFSESSEDIGKSGCGEVIDANSLLPKYIGYSLAELDELGKENFGNGKELSYVWTFIFRKSVLSKNDVWFAKGLHFMEDKLFLCEFFCFAEKVALCDNGFYHYCLRKEGLMSTNFVDNIKHAKQRLLAEKYREALSNKVMQVKGKNIEPFYQGTLILAGMELLLNCLKGSAIEQYSYYKKYKQLESVRHAYECYNPLRLLLYFPHRLLRIVNMFNRRVR